MKIEEYKSKFENYDIGQRLADLKNILEVQFDTTEPGSDYMRGMYNGLLLAWHIMREPYGKDVPYMDAPEINP